MLGVSEAARAPNPWATPEAPGWPREPRKEPGWGDPGWADFGIAGARRPGAGTAPAAARDVPRPPPRGGQLGPGPPGPRPGQPDERRPGALPGWAGRPAPAAAGGPRRDPGGPARGRPPARRWAGGRR